MPFSYPHQWSQPQCALNTFPGIAAFQVFAGPGKEASCGKGGENAGLFQVVVSLKKALIALFER